MADVLSGLRQFWKNPRTRIIFWATLTGIAMGLTNIGLPLEDALRNVRWLTRDVRSDGNIVLVLQDNATVGELGQMGVTHGTDAELLQKLFDAGADRVFFNRPFTSGTEQDDARFLSALEANPGRVFLGAAPGSDPGRGNYAGILPPEEFRARAGVVSLMKLHRPFNLNIQFPYASDSAIGRIPSLPAELARVNGGVDTLFHPDFAIQVGSFPTISYVEAMHGRFAASAVRGKDVIVGPSAMLYNEIQSIPGQNRAAAGIYVYAIGAETLKRGIPVELGWFPAFLLVLVVIITGVGRGRVLDAYRFTGLVAVLVAVPYALDVFSIQVEVIPAFAVALVSVIRMRNLDRVEVAGETNAGSGLPSVQVLRANGELSSRILVALKIRNYGAIIGSFAEHIEAQLASEIVRRIRISDEDVTIYHEGGMFVWLSTIRSTFDLFENLEGLHRIVQNGIQVGGIDVDLSFNCGVDSDFDRPLASRVASAMQSAEEAVRHDELVFQHDGRKQEGQWEISLLTSLDRAIDNGEVWVAYQPKLDLKTDRICGAEALVRWTHPERGPISPEKFIRIAEEFHRIERITRFVLNDAIRAAVELERLGYEMTMSVNISAQLLRNPGLPGMIGDILSEQGLSPNRLILEITETDRLDRSSRTFQMLQRLVQSGLRLSIDDFGTGNATLDYLRYLPASEVKIDKSFISSMETSKEDFRLVRSIVDMAHTLDRTVVAEGVETAQALQVLHEMGCDMVQGYHISRPVPFRDFLDGIARRKARMNG